MSVCHQDNPEFFDEAINSVYNQTLAASEFVLVIDGPVTNDIESVILSWKEKVGPAMKVLELEENIGLGGALNRGLAECSYDIVVRADSDDISLPNRCENQVGFLVENVDYSLVNSWVAVFEDSADDIKYVRKVPVDLPT